MGTGASGLDTTKRLRDWGFGVVLRTTLQVFGLGPHAPLGLDWKGGLGFRVVTVREGLGLGDRAAVAEGLDILIKQHCRTLGGAGAGHCDTAAL